MTGKHRSPWEELVRRNGFDGIGLELAAAALAFICGVMALVERATTSRVASTMAVNPVADGGCVEPNSLASNHRHIILVGLVETICRREYGSPRRKPTNPSLTEVRKPKNEE